MKQEMLGKRLRPTENIIISFKDEDMKHVSSPYDDALVITTKINGFDVKRIMVDSRSSTNLLFLNALFAMEITNKDLKKVDFSYIRYLGSTTYRLRVITSPWLWVRDGK